MTSTAPPVRRRTARSGVPARGRGRRLRRRLVEALIAVALLLAVAWQVTPGVDDARGRVDAELAAHRATALRGGLPAHLVQALVATEDSDFYSHPGIDLRGVLRSAKGLLAGEDLGGSTLDQQLAKNLYEDGGNSSLQRVAEVVLAVKLDSTWSKEQLLRMYLDDGYYGHGFYGITAAAQGYFGVAPADLSWPQSSLLAGLFQAPTAYDPFAHPEQAAARQAHVLDRLVAVGTLTRSQADDIAGEPWGLVHG